MYDLPENQLLKFILWKIRSLTENIELSIPDEIIEQEEWRRWVDIIASRYYKVKNISRHIYFQQISLPRIIKPRTLQKLTGTEINLMIRLLIAMNSMRNYS